MCFPWESQSYIFYMHRAGENYANDEGKEESIVMIEKDLTSGEETTEKIIISTGEDILNVEAY